MQEVKQRHEGICSETWKECLGSGNEDLQRESPGGEGTNPGYACGGRSRGGKERRSPRGL